MIECLKVLKDCENRGVVSRYAIGGAVAAIFYLEVLETEDLDVIVLLPEHVRQRLDPLSEIYQHLRSLGFEADGVHVIIHGVPVQFLIAYSPLVVEAVEQATLEPYANLTTPVIRPEHLIAILLDTGREKDRLRFCQFFQSGFVDKAETQAIIAKYGLQEKKESWIQTCLQNQ